MVGPGGALLGHSDADHMLAGGTGGAGAAAHAAALLERGMVGGGGAGGGLGWRGGGNEVDGKGGLDSEWQSTGGASKLENFRVFTFADVNGTGTPGEGSMSTPRFGPSVGLARGPFRRDAQGGIGIGGGAAASGVRGRGALDFGAEQGGVGVGVGSQHGTSAHLRAAAIQLLRRGQPAVPDTALQDTKPTPPPRYVKQDIDF